MVQWTSNSDIYYLFAPYLYFIRRVIGVALRRWWLIIDCTIYLDFYWASVVTYKAARQAYYRSANVALSTLGPINERSEGSYPKLSADGTDSLGPSVSLYA